MISGAESQSVTTLHSDESALSRIGQHVQRTFGKAVKSACACLRVVPERNAHTKEVTGEIPLKQGRGLVALRPPARS